jgi:isopenicillin-N N-acyltransferase-like protein
MTEMAHVARAQAGRVQRDPDPLDHPARLVIDGGRHLGGREAAVVNDGDVREGAADVDPDQRSHRARIEAYPAGMSIPEHHSTEASPGDRGRGFGAAQSDRIASTGEIYLRLFETSAGLSEPEVRELGAEALGRIGEFAPALADEIEGIADGSGVPLELIGALNARTEILAAGRGECSTIACLGTATATGAPIGLQTWDWHDELAGSWLRWTIDHPTGHRIETMTEAGIVGKVGVSSAGISVLLNILGHRDDGPPIGVPIHVLCRAVLDRADGAVPALETIAAAEVSASSAITVVTDEDGGAVCTVEVSPAGPGFVTADDRGVLTHTNHFLAEPGRSGDTGVRDAPGTILRLDLARRRMGAMPPGAVTPEAVLASMASHRGGASAMCCHPQAGDTLGDRWTTLATIVAEPAARELRVYRGGPCQIAAASTTAAGRWSTDRLKERRAAS